MNSSILLGGTPIDHYECDKLDVATGKWVPCAKSDTPEFDVKGLIEGHQYRFRVRAVNAEGESPSLETEHAITAKDPFSRPSPPLDVVIDVLSFWVR